MPAKAIATGRLGWYFRVVEEGEASAGCEVIACGSPHPQWTIARINRAFFGPAEQARQGLAEALALPEMSPEFVAICAKRFG
jgi:MOSC domain-containing protein YiiM